MLGLRKVLALVLVAGPLAAAPVGMVSAEMGPSQIESSMGDREILAAADANLAEARAREASLDAYITALDPQSDTLASDLRDATAALAEVRGYLAVAEQHRATLATALPDRATMWERIEHSYSMVWTACNQAVARADSVLQGSTQASRYTGDRLLIANVDAAIPQRDTTESGDLEEVVNLPGVEDRAVDSPVF